ncbi:MAG: toprim domain-containing protein [Myxococcota bacterium]
MALHGRYLDVPGRADKMLTVGAAAGWIPAGPDRPGTPLILVEGLFDALSLAAVGWPCAATIGRWPPFLPEVTAERELWLAFDRSRPAAAEVDRFVARLPAARARRLLPPPRCKDWSTALAKRGSAAVRRWLEAELRP